VEPKADHTALLMVRTGDFVQWFVPVNAPRAVPQHARLRALAADTSPQPLRFIVPASLMVERPPAPRAGAARSALSFSFGGVIKAIVHVPIIQGLVDGATHRIVEFLAQKVESHTKEEGFRFFGNGFAPVPQDQMRQWAQNGDRVLFLTHGIFSSIGGAFRDLEGTQVLADLRGKYGDRIIGWDHWTVARTPFENADAMLTGMAPDMLVDFICHSRGSLVMRAALEHSKLNTKMTSRFNGGRAGTALFVAGANQGSQLASFEHVNTLLNVYSAIASVPFLGHAGAFLDLIVGVLRVLAHGVSTIPSVAALSSDPGNTFIKELDGDPRMVFSGRVGVAHANFDPNSGILAQLGNLNVDKIFGKPNDLVVPYDGAALFDAAQTVDRELPFNAGAAIQSKVAHTTFFRNGDLQKVIAELFLP